MSKKQISYTSFSKNKNDQLKEPMFLGQNVNVARYDQQKYKFFEDLIEKQLSFFWRPEEIDVTMDRIHFSNLNKEEQHIFLSNLKYQTLLDSVQGRSPNVALLPLVSLPELETWIETWAFSETIHSRSYTHIIRAIVDNPSVIFDDIVTNKEIVKRAESVTLYYDKLIAITNKMFNENIDINKNKEFRFKIKHLIYLTMISVNVLEAVRFYVSFACSFAFGERKIMEGNAKIIKFIQRDEALHLSGTQEIIKLFLSGIDDPEMKIIAKNAKDEAMDIFIKAAEQEKQWASYLFKDGSMLGLNYHILSQYVEYITNVRLKAIGFETIFPLTKNPLPWMNNWIESSNIQVAPQETEISSYLVGQVDSSLDVGSLKSEFDFDDD